MSRAPARGPHPPALPHVCLPPSEASQSRGTSSAMANLHLFVVLGDGHPRRLILPLGVNRVIAFLFCLPHTGSPWCGHEGQAWVNSKRFHSAGRLPLERILQQSVGVY